LNDVIRQIVTPLNRIGALTIQRFNGLTWREPFVIFFFCGIIERQRFRPCTRTLNLH
jgi:hypothetical protein